LRIVLAGWFATFCGCHGLRSPSRSDPVDSSRMDPTHEHFDPSEGPVATKIPAVDADARNPQPFFKNNRRPGTWSSEAREIESHLGVK